MLGHKALERHLVREGVVDETALAQARLLAEQQETTLVDALIAAGHASEDGIYRAMAAFCEMRFVQPSTMEIPADVVGKVPAKFATHYNFVPIQERNGTLVIAVCEPMNTHLLDDIRLVLKQRVESTVTTPTEMARAIKMLYGVGAGTMERILSDNEADGSVVNLDKLSAGAELDDQNIDASIIKFVNELFSEAIRNEATDIHIEPFERELRVRFRIDGILHAVPTPASIRGFQPAIVSRVKIMAGLNIAEKRLPQDGKIRANLGTDQFDLRVSILPTPHGETVNLRILNRASMFMSLEDLGFREDDLKRFNTFITKPHGMILVTGPTGSGKTTTLYAALAKLNKLEHKVITIEDPIEYQLQGITQMQVLPQIKFGFSSALRAMLRHDPDIMLVGEIRDFETAEMAVRSSLTGHLVFSTLHTNDAAGAVTRLTDMGVEPFLIASTMIASMAQRLVRRICSHCAESCPPDPALLDEAGLSASRAANMKFMQGKGCEQCRNTGYHGRIAIYEVLPFTPEIKHLTMQRATSTEIKRMACKQGMVTLRESGWLRVAKGMTTIEEIMRVTSEADMEVIETGDAPVQV